MGNRMRLWLLGLGLVLTLQSAQAAREPVGETWTTLICEPDMLEGVPGIASLVVKYQETGQFWYGGSTQRDTLTGQFVPGTVAPNELRFEAKGNTVALISRRNGRMIVFSAEGKAEMMMTCTLQAF